MLRVAWGDQYAHSLPSNHRFPMEKYELLPQQLMHEGTLTRDQFFTPDPVVDSQILTVHELSYWSRLNGLALSPAEIRRTGFPLSRALVDREIVIAGGTVQCAEYALEHGAALNVAGGTHHAFTNRGEGFCLLNDIAVAAQHLLTNSRVQHVLVIDLDVHQGNGTAQIFRDEPRVFTFSMHGANNYPLEKEVSDLDVPLPDGIRDTEYLDLLSKHLETLFTQAPDLVFYQCGVDVLAQDKLGRLGLTIDGAAAGIGWLLRGVFTSAFRGWVSWAEDMHTGWQTSLKRMPTPTE